MEKGLDFHNQDHQQDTHAGEDEEDDEQEVAISENLSRDIEIKSGGNADRMKETGMHFARGNMNSTKTPGLTNDSFFGKDTP